jgi:predicted enzyme related to lactoylglutathione lyase
MLKLGMVMVGSSQPKVMGEFYEKVLGKAPDFSEAGWYGWMNGEDSFAIGEHSEVKGKAKEPQRVIFNFTARDAKDVKKEYERVKALGAKVVKELYEMEGMEGMWIATFADPDGNYFQITSPMEMPK